MAGGCLEFAVECWGGFVCLKEACPFEWPFTMVSPCMAPDLTARQTAMQAATPNCAREPTVLKDNNTDTHNHTKIAVTFAFK